MSTNGARGAPSLWAAALAGALAGGAAIAASELFAGLTGAPSLIVGIGAQAISLQPPGAKDVMVALFGTNDKLALNLIIVVAAIAISAGAGILAAWRFPAGAAVFIAFGVVAAGAAAQQPLASPALAFVNAAVAVTAGLLTLRWLLGLAVDDTNAVAIARASGPPTSETATSGQTPSRPMETSLEVRGDVPGPAISREGAPIPAVAAVAAADGPAGADGATGGALDWPRRRFLIASAGVLGGALVAGSMGRTFVDAQHEEGVITSTKLPAPTGSVAPLTADESLAIPGITPLVVPNDKFYRIDTALLVPHVDLATWQVKVTGMVDHPLAFTYDQLLAMPLYEQYVTIACVSNDVGGHLVGNALWTGVRLKDVLRSAGIQAGATQIVGRSVDGFTVGFPTDWAMAPEREPMIAVGMGREPLPAAHGFPARLIVPGLYGYVSATKWLSEIELTTRDAVDGYWVPLGWAKDAPILTQSRIDVPTSGGRVPVGHVDIAGVAWAPDRGIERVEVRIDDGDWQAARISRPISAATWVQWTFGWTAPAGRHTVEVRATDGTGEVQTDQQTTPAPDGARGHDRITVNVG
jgi:DMSO/TMAO reductase YedYZ molybdopterin-dependent catalytic subunit